MPDARIRAAAAAHGLCFSCLKVAERRGQTPGSYAAEDERWPAAKPRATFGLCRAACDALAVGGDGLCGEHLRHWRRARRPAGPAFAVWRDQRSFGLPASRFVDLKPLTGRLEAEVLVGLGASIERHRRTRISELRRVVSLLADANVGSLLEVDPAGIRGTSTQLFVAFCQERIRLALSDPNSEFRKEVWDLRVFGKPQAYRLDFTAVAQPWLRALAKQWAREKPPLVHAMTVKRILYAIAALSRALTSRDDGGSDPRALGRADASALLVRFERLQRSGRLTEWQRRTFTAELAQFLREARDLGLAPRGGRCLGCLPRSR